MMIVHKDLETVLLPAKKVQAGMKIEVMDDENFGKCTLSEVLSITQVVATKYDGLANILTSSETIIVNGIVGSVHTETSAERPGRKLLKTVHSLMGTIITRWTYRILEWALENDYVSIATI